MTITSRTPSSPPSGRAAVARVVVPAAVVALLAAGCSAPANSGTAPSAPSTPTPIAIPDTDLTVIQPAGWVRSSQDGDFVLRAPGTFGRPPFRANVVVTTADCSGTLDEAAARTATGTKRATEWTADADGQGKATLNGLPAYRLSGILTHKTLRVAQTLVVVRTGTDADCATVFLTASAAAADDAGRAAALGVVASAVAGRPPATKPTK